MPGRANHQWPPMLQRETADLIKDGGRAEIDSDVTRRYTSVNGIPGVNPRINRDLRITFCSRQNRLAHSATRTDQANLNGSRHAVGWLYATFAFGSVDVFSRSRSKTSTVLRKRSRFASLMAHNGSRTSDDIRPLHSSAALIGTGFGSMNRSLNKA